MAVWKEDLVVKNKFSRPALSLPKTNVEGVVMHWTATPGASDENEQNYFDGSDGGGGRYASAHLFVDRDSATLIIPLDEVAYHANDKTCKVAKFKPNANFKSIGVEMCVEKNGTIHKETIARTAQVVAELCKKFKLDPLSDIYRHYDVTGKNCPAPWVSNPDEFTAFKKSVKDIVGGTSTVVVAPAKSKGYLEKGDKGGAVQELQTLLEKAGHDVGAIDGIFGKGTDEALRAFQKANKLSVDGLAGSATINKLKEVDAKAKAEAKKKADAKKKAEAEAKAKKEADAKKKAEAQKKADAKKKAEEAEDKKKLSADIYGTVKVLAENLNIREKADFNSKIVDVAKKGETLKVYAQKNGLYHLGGKKYTTANSKYVKFTKNANYGKNPKTKVLEVLAGELYTYKSANWDDKGVIVKKGEVFTIAKELTVSASKMYQLKSGLFISANPKYVKVTTK